MLIFCILYEDVNELIIYTDIHTHGHECTFMATKICVENEPYIVEVRVCVSMLSTLKRRIEGEEGGSFINENASEGGVHNLNIKIVYN